MFEPGKFSVGARLLNFGYKVGCLDRRAAEWWMHVYVAMRQGSVGRVAL
jgi:hypothetical protein